MKNPFVNEKNTICVDNNIIEITKLNMYKYLNVLSADILTPE